MIDIHLHTKFSFDSVEEPKNYIDKCIEKGGNSLGFSEHYDYDAHLDGAGIALCDIGAYLKEVERLSAFSNVNIMRGIEFGYRSEALTEYKRILDNYPLDYVINSVHTLKGRGDCFHDDFFVGKSLKESYLNYFNAVYESVCADYDYQIIGHLGYVSRYRDGKNVRIIYKDFKQIIDKILLAIIVRDKCLEINSSVGTSGSEFLPDLDIVERYIELGGKKLSFGSDAHSADRYLGGAEKLKIKLKNLGVNELYYYKSRKPVTYKI